MTRAAAVVQNRILIEAEDSASRKLAQTERRLRGIDKRVREADKSAVRFGKNFAHAGGQAAERAGSLSTALSSLGDFAGKDEESFRSASEAAGAFEDVLKALPGPVGLVGAAISGLTTVTYLQVKASREADARLKQAFGGENLAQVRALRDEFGLTAESAVTLGDALIDSGRSAEDVRDDLRAVVKRAKEVGEDGSDAVAKFAAKLSKTATDAQKLTRRLKALGVEVRKISVASATAGTAMAEFGKGADKDAASALGKVATKASEAAAKLKDLEEGRRGPLARLKEHQGAFASFVASTVKSSKFAKAEQRAREGQNQAIAAQRAELQKLREEAKRIQDVQQATADTAAEAAKVERTAAREEAEEEHKEANRAKAEADRRKARDAAAKSRARSRSAATKAARVAAEGVRRAREGERALFDGRRRDLQTQQLVARVSLVEAKSLQDKIAAERELGRIRREQQVTDIESQGNKLDSDQRAKRIAAVFRLTEAETSAKVEALKKQAAAEDKLRADLETRRVAAQRAQLAGQLRDAAGALGGSTGGEQFLSAMADIGAQTVATYDQVARVVPGAIAAIGQAGAKRIKAIKGQSAVLGLFYGAEAIAAGVSGNVPGAVGYGLSAAKHLAIAGGLLGGGGGGGGGGPAAAPAGQGGASPGFAARNGVTDRTGGGGGGGGTTIINLHGIATTDAQVAKGLKQADAALAGTGV